ncbi:MAG: hypothetical protein HC838_15415 [Spirulinaceae cyanobacterium RM2_2_10]|nr:hypothetical protein [Spirulinaceae cyanobacterium SM2_1_0]NJO21142.1 hypothetical protein [Spirulinaceae cyanobacterium RM2_2_10]
MGKLTPLTADSRLSELPLHYFQISPNAPSSAVAAQFEREPWLPGAIVAEGGRLHGLISRRRFNTWLSSPYGLEVFLERPIEIFLNLSQQQTSVLQLPDTEKVTVAIEHALDRSADEIYDPVVVLSQDVNLPDMRVYFLLAFQTLVRAQSQISSYVGREIQKQRLEGKRYQIKYEREQQRTEKYRRILNSQRGAIAERQDLANRQAEQEQHFQDLLGLLQRLVRTGQLGTHQGQRAFQGALASVDVLLRNTYQVADIANLLGEELDRVQTLSQLVSTVSQQVRHLALQSAIAINQSGTKLSGFSQIASEIGKLGTRTVEAGRELDRIAVRFADKIQELSGSTQAGMRVARSLIKKVECAEIALADLEELLTSNELASLLPDTTNGEVTVSALPDSGDTWVGDSKSLQTLVQRIVSAERTLAHLAEIDRLDHSAALARRIQRALAHHRQLAAQVQHRVP